MIEYPSFYQFGFYAPDAHKEPDPDIIGRLLRAFKDKNFIPTTVREFQLVAQGPQAGFRPGNRLQLQFITPNQEWNLGFEQQRVLLKKGSLTDTKIGTPAEFRIEAVGVVRLLLGEIPFSGTRLSYATKGLLPEMPVDGLTEANKRVLSPVQFYLENPPREWSTRNVARIEASLGAKREILNVITGISRVQGAVVEGDDSKPIDRIEVAFDINTDHENTAQRFAAEDIDPFLQVALEKSEQILKEIEAKLHE